MEKAAVFYVQSSLLYRRNKPNATQTCTETTRKSRSCISLKSQSADNLCRVSQISTDDESFGASMYPKYCQIPHKTIGVRRSRQHNERARSRPVRSTARRVPGAISARTDATGPGFVSFKGGPGFAQFSSPTSGSSSESVLSPTSKFLDFGGWKLEVTADSRILLPLKWAQRTFQSLSVPSFPLGEPPQAALSMKSFSWLLAPIILVLSIHFPPFYLGKIMNNAFGGTNVEVFAGLLITDLSYLVGAAVFIALAFQQGVHFITPPGSLPWVRLSTPPLHPPPGVTKWIAFVWILGCILPLATILLCTPFGTGPMAAAVLVPYFVLLLAEYLMETWPKMVHSPVWPIIPILFQGYRVFQLNRGATMILDLLLTLPSIPEPTSAIAAAASTLSWLLTSLHSLLYLWTTSLGAVLCLLPCFYAVWGREEQSAATT